MTKADGTATFIPGDLARNRRHDHDRGRKPLLHYALGRRAWAQVNEIVEHCKGRIPGGRGMSFVQRRGRNYAISKPLFTREFARVGRKTKY